MTEPTASLLLVDDDPATLTGIPALLSFRLPRVTVVTCQNADEALEQLHAVEYDVVLSDVGLRGRSGLQLLSDASQVRPFTPFILITGYPQQDVLARALASGAYDFVRKPVDRDELTQTIRRAVEARYLRRSLAAHEARSADLAGQVAAITATLAQARQNGIDDTAVIAAHETAKHLLHLLRRSTEEQLDVHARLRALLRGMTP